MNFSYSIIDSDHVLESLFIRVEDRGDLGVGNENCGTEFPFEPMRFEEQFC